VVTPLRDVSVRDLMRRACTMHLLVPAFNVAYLPMIEPIAQTLKALDSFGLIEVARPDIERFGAKGYREVAEEHRKWADPSHVRLHQDHVPVIDEEQRRVDWEPLVQEALDLGYDSVMIDGSRLPLDENIAVTRRVVEMAHPDVAVEGELGAVLGHEPGPLPPYEELFRTGKGFTDADEALRFVAETDVDWLSVAIGTIHGAISGAAKDRAKPEARLSIDHLRALSTRLDLPLVLHGGTGIRLCDLNEAAAGGIAKINIATAIRQPYERCLREDGSVAAAQEAVAEAVRECLESHGVVGMAGRLGGA
jgi:fructose/tagatose bisphosphate aldolase